MYCVLAAVAWSRGLLKLSLLQRHRAYFWTLSERIGHIQYINILTWLRGFHDKLLYLMLFSLYRSLSWDFDLKAFCVMLEYLYIERGLLLIHGVSMENDIDVNGTR